MAKENYLNASAKFANIEFEDRDGYTSQWIYRTPDYLTDEVKVGDTVVVRYNDRLKTGVVVELLPSTRLRPDQVGFILDRVNVERYERFLEREKERNLLLTAMEERKELNERLASYLVAAEGDPELAKMLASYYGTEDDPEAEPVSA